MAWAGVAGVLFGAGLVISGMTDPRNVLSFLDVTGAWNPSLAAVMVGAIGVHALALRVFRRQRTPLCAGAFQAPPAGKLDVRLLVGAAVFGAGWGLAGYCPGPAVVSSGWSGDALAFTAAMVAGMALQRAWERRALTTTEVSWASR